jgi:hypothetical protein
MLLIDYFQQPAAHRRVEVRQIAHRHGDGQNKQIAFPAHRPATVTSSRSPISRTPCTGCSGARTMEKVFTEGSFIEAQITVQGWFGSRG